MSGLFTFLLVVQALVAAAMIAVILMQKSEGGGLGIGGSPSGLLSARGAADFMTRATAVLATLFVVLSIGLAAMAAAGRSGSTIDTSLSKSASPVSAPAGSLTAPAEPVNLDDPLAAAKAAAAAQDAAPAPQAPETAPANK